MFDVFDIIMTNMRHEEDTTVPGGTSVSTLSPTEAPVFTTVPQPTGDTELLTTPHMSSLVPLTLPSFFQFPIIKVNLTAYTVTVLSLVSKYD